MRILLKSFILGLLVVTIANATIINIPVDYSTIQNGIDAASNNDTVLVQPGTYVENINYNEKNIVVGSLFITTNDTSYISQTVIDVDSSGTVVTFGSGEDSTAFLSGFMISNGSAVYGGGIYYIYSIQYDLPQRSDVQITIFDLQGREITTLVSEDQDAGFRSVNWNATNNSGKSVSAGMYFYQIRICDPDGIRAGDFVRMKKMALLK